MAERLEKLDPRQSNKGSEEATSSFAPTESDFEKLKAEKDDLEQRALKSLAMLLDKIDSRDSEIAKLKATVEAGESNERAEEGDGADGAASLTLSGRMFQKLKQVEALEDRLIALGFAVSVGLGR